MKKHTDNKTIVDIAVKKMLSVLGLRATRRRINRKINLVSESTPGNVRVFRDSHDGKVMSIFIDPTNRKDFDQVFPCSGSWTFFKNDNQATFDVFTKSIREYSFENCPSLCISNPFFGCSSPEEVMVKCDLMAE